MAVYIATWNLNQERSNYNAARKAFLDHLERYENIGDPNLETVRWVSTNWTARQVSDDLRLKLDDNDRLFVSRVTSENAGWVSKKVWDWINAKV